MELCIKTSLAVWAGTHTEAVSILVLMELCIKTYYSIFSNSVQYGFNPCFNGTMYKNTLYTIPVIAHILVSILVLMELCIKTKSPIIRRCIFDPVSILVLMELCIKTILPIGFAVADINFHALF